MKPRGVIATFSDGVCSAAEPQSTKEEPHSTNDELQIIIEEPRKRSGELDKPYADRWTGLPSVWRLMLFVGQTRLSER